MSRLMRQADSDKLLKRRLYLQRFVTSVFNDIANANRALDRDLISLIASFIADADDKTLSALADRRTSNKAAKALLADIKAIVDLQRINAGVIVRDQSAALIPKEVAVTTAAMNMGAGPGVRGVASRPIAGRNPTAILPIAFTQYADRLTSEITKSAGVGPADMIRMVRGTRSKRFKDGLFHWRNERLIRPNVDQIVNGTAANSTEHVYKHFKVELVDHSATLDYRTCARCYKAEMEGPYELGKQPRLPIHPRCRCQSLPHLSDDAEDRNVRSYMRAEKLRDIPNDQREGKTGRTRDNIAQFFNRMGRDERRKYMGKKRFELYEEGKIDIGDLVAQRSLRPLRLDELPD